MSIDHLSNHEIKNNKRRIIIPLGSIEQHGPHLPITTDTIIAEYLANQISKKIPSYVLPNITYGVSYEHKPFFNVSISNDLLSELLSQICISLGENGFHYLIILNGHHGNMGVLQYVPQKVAKTNKRVNVFGINYWQLTEREFDHAGFVETSLMLAIEPKLVQIQKTKRGYVDEKRLHATYSTFLNNPSSFKITKNGIWGDPTKASKEEGQKIISITVKNLVRSIKELEELDDLIKL
jgi:creatinine amidohydrolase